MQLECHFVSAASLTVQGDDFVSQSSRNRHEVAKVNCHFFSEKPTPCKSHPTIFSLSNALEKLGVGF
jgi:hypothetical protein